MGIFFIIIIIIFKKDGFLRLCNITINYVYHMSYTHNHVFICYCVYFPLL